MRNQEIITIQEKLFQVSRKFPKNQINLEKGNVEDLKIFFHCDTLFKAKGFIWFVNEIKTIEYEELR
tara:strand:- start:326 stop:526 length:201 start_codon:yes stop_codon:yes gene_type:complete